ncbi:MAG: hypothetical protein JXM70_19105 [Pirellulales bacterium]|nr:hypothetical protein [Pirellulales bacterium]
MNSLRIPIIAYVLNATLILCHEIDSGYWKEWELFQLPGGIELFVSLHVFMIGFILLGLVLLAQNAVTGRWFALVIGLGGSGGAILHLYFLACGDQRFATTFSIGLIVAFLVSSVTQVFITVRYWKSPLGYEVLL